MRLSRSEAVRREYIQQISDQRKKNQDQMRMSKGFNQQIDDMEKSQEDILKIRNRESNRQLKSSLRILKLKLKMSQ